MTDSNPKLCLTEYSEKAVVVHGTATKEYKESIKAFGGKWCNSLKGSINSGGWVFPKKCKDAVDAYVTKALESGANESLLQWAQENTLKKAKKKQSSVSETTSSNVAVNAAANLHEVLVRIAVALEKSNELSTKLYDLQEREYQRATTTELDNDDCDDEDKEAKKIEDDLQPTSEEESEDSEEEEIPEAPVDVKPKRRLLKGPKTAKKGVKKVVRKVVRKKKTNDE